MLKTPARLLSLLPFLAALTFTSTARANPINGVVYCNISSADASNTPAPGVTPSGTECATFAANELVFYSNGSSATNNLGSFLNYHHAIAGDVNYLNGYTADSNLDFSFFQFTGSAYFENGMTYHVAHDDGVVLNVDGVTVVNAPQPTSPVDTPFVFNGSTGFYDFTYDYTEQQGGSLFYTDATEAPEPASLALLGTGALAMIGLASYRRRRGVSPDLHA